MKKPGIALINCLFILSVTCLNAQQVTTTTGAKSTTTTGTATHKAGQKDYIAANGSEAEAPKSVPQPFTISVENGKDQAAFDLSYAVYPKRSTDFVTLTVKPNSFGKMSLRLSTVKGQVILDQKVTAGKSSIMMPDYSSPVYYLNIYDDDKEVKSFKIIKNK